MPTFRPYEPDHRTICRFREQHLAAFERLFVQVVQIARDTGLVRMGTLAVDGSGAFQQCYNAQTAVDGQQRIIVATSVQQSASDVPALERRKIKGYIATGREGKSARTPNPKAHATRRMVKTLRSKRGRAKYKRRKHIAEPPFGWMKRGLGFRQFSLRGLGKVSGEFNLVCMALNLRRMAEMIRWA